MGQGLSIAVIGITIVFCFLIILVAAMLGLNAVLKRFFPKAVVEQFDHTRPETNRAAGDGIPDPAVVAVAVASIKAHLAVNRG